MTRQIALFVVLLLGWSEEALAEPPEPAPRQAAPDPAAGESPDGIHHKKTAKQRALIVPRILLFPFRLLFWGLEPAARVGVESEQRHHVLDHLYYAFTSADGQIGARPTFQWYRSFRPSVGVHLFHDRLLGPGTSSSFDAAGWVDVVAVGFHLRPTRIGRPVQAYFDASYDRRNDWLFTGIGSTAPFPPNTTARYRQDRIDQGARVDLRPTSYLSFTLGGYLGFRRYGNGESYGGDPPILTNYCLVVDGVCTGVVNDALVPQFNQGTQFVRGAAGVHLDLRDNLVRPTIGLLINGEADYSHGFANDPSSYFRVRGDVGIALNLFRHSHVLILRGATELVLPLDDRVVPFSELAILGGPNDLRGFRWQTFRGFSSLIGTAEYRWPILPWVDSALFVDYGGVFGKKFQGFGAGQMQPDVGFAFRLHTKDRFYLRAQIAYGFDGGGWQFYFTGQNVP